MKRKEAKMIDFIEKGDERGKLVVVEALKDIPFEIKRIFYMYGSEKNVIRGQHANKKSQFVLINVSGSSKIRVDNGDKSEVIVLDRPNKGIYIPSMIWKDMFDFSEDSVLLVLSDQYYDSEEYIRDYEQYCKMIKVRL
ncbi:sugar 3,4-ketoisomerase [Blautia sp. An81]|uniref:sugar 3,4-ketoisomerase n=1 Tax=Blautia sp. An81 TaxID=1965659 RepID=UPI000B3A3A9A|nr:FdtA/QdtA family cupin domain-containing protein [Blautia sp. An81]OUN25655.1 dTDP-6-deoxy-3,4-keto-hexulose isomerase [Blautia sp. An81]